MGKEEVEDYVEKRVQSKMQTFDNLIWNLTTKFEAYAEKDDNRYVEQSKTNQFVQDTLTQILSQTTKTNGRVTVLETCSRETDKSSLKIAVYTIIGLVGLLITSVTVGLRAETVLAYLSKHL